MVDSILPADRALPPIEETQPYNENSTKRSPKKLLCLVRILLPLACLGCVVAFRYIAEKKWGLHDAMEEWYATLMAAYWDASASVAVFGAVHHTGVWLFFPKRINVYSAAIIRLTSGLLILLALLSSFFSWLVSTLKTDSRLSLFWSLSFIVSIAHPVFQVVALQKHEEWRIKCTANGRRQPHSFDPVVTEKTSDEEQKAKDESIDAHLQC